MLQEDKKIYYVLRFAAAMCFIGHGSFGMIGKQIWYNYFAVFGIDHNTGSILMPLMGGLDVLMGISLLVYPTKIVLWWLVIWGLVTAMLRPLSGEPFGELIERAGNFGAPLALLILCGQNTFTRKGWFSLVRPDTPIDAKTLRSLTQCLKIVVFLLLAGHGWLNLIDKKGLLQQYASLGFSNPGQVALIAGTFEIAGALSILIKPLRPVILILFVWKAGTELFYPHWELFEWVERGGSYGSLLALWFILPRFAAAPKQKLAAT